MSKLKIRIHRLLKVIAVLAVLAMVITGYLIYLHYAPNADSFCVISETFDCDIVNQSEWSTLFGVPVAVLGFLTYVLIFVLSLACVKDVDFRRFWIRLRPKRVLQLLAFITFFGAAFSMYLSYIELFVLQTICILCATQQIIIFIQMLLAFAVLIMIDQDASKKEVCEFC